MRRRVLEVRRQLDAEYEAIAAKDAALEQLEEQLEGAAFEWNTERGSVFGHWITPGDGLRRLLVGDDAELEPDEAGLGHCTVSCEIVGAIDASLHQDFPQMISSLGSAAVITREALAERDQQRREEDAAERRAAQQKGQRQR